MRRGRESEAIPAGHFCAVLSLAFIGGIAITEQIMGGLAAVVLVVLFTIAVEEL